MRQRGAAFYFERVVGGRRYKLKLPFTKAQAFRHALEINERLASGGRFDDLLRGRRVSLREFYELLREKIAEKRGANKKSLRARLKTMRRFLSSQSPLIDRLHQVTPEVVERLVVWRSRTPVARNGSPYSRGPKKVPAQATITEDVRIFRSFFEHALEVRWIRENPFQRVKTPKQPKREFQPIYLDDRQVNRLLQAAVDYDSRPRQRGSQSTYRGFMADMTRLFLLTGLRAKEMRSLTWDQVELDWGVTDGFAGRLRIEPYETKATIRIPLKPEQAEQIRSSIGQRLGEERLFPNKEALSGFVPGKYVQSETKALLRIRPRPSALEGGALRIRKRYVFRPKGSSGNVPLTWEARAILQTRLVQRGESPFVFPHPDGGKLRSDYWAQFKIILAAAGLPSSVRVHDLRHTFGMRLRQKGVGLETLMGLMRHKNVTETRLYARYRDEEGALAVKKLTQCLRLVEGGDRPPVPHTGSS